MMRVMPRLAGPAIPPGRLARLAQPVLDLTDMVLRPWQSSDLSAVAAAYSDPDIQYWHARSMTEAESRLWIDSWPVRWAEESGAGWAENAGYAMEGTKRGEALHPDGWHDMHLHGRLSSDLPREGDGSRGQAPRRSSSN
jgi:hypothetical protein